MVPESGMADVLDEVRLHLWLHHLTGGTWPSPQEEPDRRLPDWFTNSIIPLRSPQDLRTRTRFATGAGPFSAALLRAEIGDLVLFSAVGGPHTLSFADHTAVPVVLLGGVTEGGIALRTQGRTEVAGTGGAGFVTSGSHTGMEHLAHTETTGVIVPLDRLASFRPLWDRGSALCPSTPLTQMAFSAFGRLLVSWLAEGSQDLPRSAEAMVLGLVRGVLAQFPAVDPLVSSRGHAAAVGLIERHHTDPDFSVEALAKAMFISRRQLYRYFVSQPIGVHELLALRRLEAAQELLASGQRLPLAEVARRSGFRSAAALRSNFRRHLRLTPSEFHRSVMSGIPELAESNPN